MSSQGSSEHDDLSCVLNQHYEVKVRPCIDLVDHLRALGVEKDINLPAIAVIGDQSSGKSSVLEALSGVALPRGTGIVTRCPLVLKLKKVRKEEGWHGVLSFRDKRKKLINPAEIEKAVLVAQTALAGQGEGISHEMITLEIQSSDVPDLTLIDLPGIARVATGNQPKDIEQQIKDLIEKFIKKQETISLVVVPANIDIATTEALKMASSVDPDGHKTLGILTKPDLVDKGMEETVVRTVNNLVIELKKGYMIVKCRGQQDINDKLTLDKALEKEREFFSEHPHFRSLLEDGKATIPILSEILTKELVEHITNSLPQLSQKLGKKLEKTKEDLKVLGDGVPLDPDERDSYFITIIQQYNNVLQGVKRAEDEVKESGTKVYSKIRMKFNTWKCQMETKFTNAFLAGNILSDAVVKDIRAHRGKELPGVVDNTTFESLVRKYIDELEKPALKLLKDVRDIIHSCVNTIVNQHFGGFPLLLRAAEDSFKECLETEFLKTEEQVKNQFIFEKTIFCQDSVYIQQLLIVQQKTNVKEITDVSEMAKHLSAYFKITTDRLANQVPLIIQYHMLDQYISHLQTAMNLIMKRSDAEDLLKEDAKVARKRTVLNERLNRLMNAGQLLSQFLHSVY